MTWSVSRRLDPCPSDTGAKQASNIQCVKIDRRDDILVYLERNNSDNDNDNDNDMNDLPSKRCTGGVVVEAGEGREPLLFVLFFWEYLVQKSSVF
mmetsp:Transcript_43657/g.105854  ORF Transcript_43657/g.105854 Transcript_43657/m.105854 type:complete len:95 (+) Transcript_43657:2784-3068(+)